LREAYRQIAATEPERCVLIDASAEAATVASNIWAAVRERLLAASASSAVKSGMSANSA
jgi:dTMP kinase